MPIRKIRDLDSQELCRHPDHLPPMHMYLENGVYEYTCPGCGRRLEFTVRHPTFGSLPDRDRVHDAFGHQDVTYRVCARRP
jgi:hypothetical protein